MELFLPLWISPTPGMWKHPYRAFFALFYPVSNGLYLLRTISLGLASWYHAGKGVLEIFNSHRTQAYTFQLHPSNGMKGIYFLAIYYVLLQCCCFSRSFLLKANNLSRVCFKAIISQLLKILSSSLIPLALFFGQSWYL